MRKFSEFVFQDLNVIKYLKHTPIDGSETIISKTPHLTKEPPKFDMLKSFERFTGNKLIW